MFVTADRLKRIVMGESNKKKRDMEGKYIYMRSEATRLSIILIVKIKEKRFFQYLILTILWNLFQKNLFIHIHIEIFKTEGSYGIQLSI